jgi:outer membrane protein TolC
MELSMIKQNLDVAEANLDYAKNAYEQAKAFFKKGELDKATFDKVCERTIQADIALCDAMIIASKNGYYTKKES